MNKIFRTINYNYPTLSWSDAKKIKNPFDLRACHWGQLKLFYSELEFLTLCSKYFNLKECVIVYIGSAPGTHIEFLKNLFPELYWILYDPAKFVVKSDKNIEIHTGKDGFFTNNKVQEVLNNPKIKGKKILYISDIRTHNESGRTRVEHEKDIFDDMVQQQNWIIMMNADIYMLKFRLPHKYYNPDISQFQYELPKQYKDRIIIKDDEEIDKDNKIMYLDGNIFLQISPPSSSTETRLIGLKSDDKFILKYYDRVKYDNQLQYFNLKDRFENYYYDESEDLKNYLIGFDNSYDRVCEYFIYSQYVKYYLKETDKKERHNKAIKFLYETHHHLSVKAFKNILSCPIDTISKNLHKINEFINDIGGKENIIEFKKILLNNYDKLINFIEDQIDYFESNRKKISNVLNNKQIDYQIQNGQIALNRLKTNIDKITERFDSIYLKDKN